LNNERARTILSAYRLDGADAAEPVFTDALAQLQRDPELARWFAEECALDDRMHAALRSIRPPANLRDAILLTAKISGMPARRVWWANPAWFTAAAASFLFASLCFFFLHPRSERMTIAEVTFEMAQMQREERISLGTMTSDPEATHRWLKEHGGPAEFAVPAGLARQTSLGCQVLEIKGNMVSLVCYEIGSGKVVHLLVLDRRRLTDPPAVGKPMFLQAGELAFATWSEGNRTYVIVGQGPAESLRQWL